MIRDITLGQYYSREASLHKLDPRTKIIGTIIYIAALFVSNDFAGIAISAAAIAAVVAVSRVPISFIMRGLKPILFIIIFTFCLNIFMVDGQILWQWGVLKITIEGLQRAFFMAARLILLIIGSSLLTLTTKPISLTDGIERLLGPLGRIGVPAHEIAMMMSIALRFIPTLLEETDKIMKAQQARGADFESGNLLTRIKALIPILVPLFVSAFRIAQDLAMAMESRCYKGGQGRTRMHQMKLQQRDALAGLLLAIYLAVVIAERVWI
jgi:energy-coupling factor transport system permease protein